MENMSRLAHLSRGDLRRVLASVNRPFVKTAYRACPELRPAISDCFDRETIVWFEEGGGLAISPERAAHELFEAACRLAVYDGRHGGCGEGERHAG